MKRHAPACERNRNPILEVLQDLLPSEGTVLEIAAGTGQHAEFLSGHFPKLKWQPTDRDPTALASIASYQEEAGHPNLQAPTLLDVMKHPWPVDEVDAILCVNMIHISPWESTIALLDGAKAHLKSDGILYLYGPYRMKGTPTSPSNEAFDQSLKSRNPGWGLRSLERVVDEAAQRDLTHVQTLAMPANNLSVILRRQ
jgi:SAM-dependent methyltransferase